MKNGPPEPIATARRLAEEELFPHALETDAADLVPRARLDALAAAGLYAIAGPPELAGIEPGVGFARVIEELASGCLTTTFVWAQHHNAVRTVSAVAPDELRRRFLEPLCSGALRAGVAFAGLRRPGAPLLRARRQGNDVILEGSAPWVTGWGRVDLIHVAAKTDDDSVIWVLLDAVPAPTLGVEALELAAVSASGTVALRFDGHLVAGERVTFVEPFATWQARDRLGLRPNGSHGLGVARRAALLADDSDVLAEIDRCRDVLDGASVDALPAARAWASELALRACALLVANTGGRAVLRSSHAQRLAREAIFLLVFGQTEAIRPPLSARLRAGAD